MIEFCTYFDANYLNRAIPLWESLGRWCQQPWRLHALCFDDVAVQGVRQLAPEHVVAVPVAELEAFDPEFAGTRTSRSRVEYYFTSTPCLIRYLLGRIPAGSSITYLDADLHFYSSPQPIFDEMADQSVLIIPHRFAPRLAFLEENGVYNVAFMVFRRDAVGSACADWWRERCLEWCYDRHEEGRFADQKYLDDWPVRFGRVCVLAHKGANVAPWNVNNYTIARRAGQLFVDEDPLIFYHFHGYRQLTPHLVDPGIFWHDTRCPVSVLRAIHKPYIEAVRRARQRLAHAGAVNMAGNTRYHESSELGKLSWAYRFRFFLEGQAFGYVGRRAFLLDPAVTRPLLAWYDRLRGRKSLPRVGDDEVKRSGGVG